MSYTPTTAKMFEAYYNYLRHTSRTSRDAEAEFDRWLAEVKADAWDEGWLHNVDDRIWSSLHDNPYREID